MDINLWQGVMNGFAAGLGSGIANFLILKRFETFEKKLLRRKK